MLCLVLAMAFSNPTEAPLPAATAGDSLSDDALLTRVQQQTFQYFWEGAESTSGMARERYHVDGYYPQDDKHVVTTGGSGFGLMALVVGIERGFITRAEGLERFEQIVGFLEEADRFHGVWPHWLDGTSGAVQPFSPQDDGGDLVETAFLVQGLLTVRQYLADGSAREQALAERIDTLWRAVEWDWHTQGGENVLYWHWSPNHGWAMDHPVRGYDETLITYVLAASSPTHPISAEVYHEGWARGGAIRREENPEQHGPRLALRHNYAEEYGGPLFWAHYSYLGLDPRGLVDRYADYGTENVNHARLNHQWAVENPNDCAGYGPESWGLTASYSPNEDGSVGYAAHRPGDAESDRCVISPTAALASFPYAPEPAMAALEHFYYDLKDRLWGPYGFYDAFSIERDWFPPRYLAIDQGPIAVMIENHRTGLLWELFMSSPEVQEGLRTLGFESPHLE